MKMTSTYQFATAFTHSPNKLLNAVASQVSVKNLFLRNFCIDFGSEHFVCALQSYPPFADFEREKFIFTPDLLCRLSFREIVKFVLN